MTLDGLLGDGTDRPALPLQDWGLRSAPSCFASQRWLGELWAEVSRLGTLVSFPGIEVFQGGFEKSASSREIVVSHDRTGWLPRCPPAGEVGMELTTLQSLPSPGDPTCLRPHPVPRR